MTLSRLSIPTTLTTFFRMTARLRPTRWRTAPWHRIDCMRAGCRQCLEWLLHGGPRRSTDNIKRRWSLAWQELLFSCSFLHRIFFCRKLIGLCHLSVLWAFDISTLQPSPHLDVLWSQRPSRGKKCWPCPSGRLKPNRRRHSPRWQLPCYMCWGLCGEGASLPSKPSSVVPGESYGAL